MQLKKDNDNRLDAVLRFLYMWFYNKKTTILYIFAIFLAGCFFGLGIAGFFGSLDDPSPITAKMMEATVNDAGFTQDVLSGFLHEKYKLPVNYISGLKANPERITIDIKTSDFQKLSYKREIALAQDVLICSEEDYVPAKIQHNGETVDVKLRLKGDWIGQLRGEKWSFRIRVKGDDTLFGMRQFSIHHPQTRNYINEWIYHQALKTEGITALRYDFIDVTINGKHKGIYALEEHFEKRLIERNLRRDGVIIRFNEELVWAGGTVEDGTEYYFSSDIDAFHTNKILEDPTKYDQFQKANNLLESFRRGELNTSDVFDVDQLARFFAITDLMGAEHGSRWHNIRFYYNPITSRLEPIGFDGDSGQRISSIIGTMSNGYCDTIFSDPVFFKQYACELERVSQPTYLDDLFTELDAGLTRNMGIIHKEYFWYHFSKDVFYDNQNYIRTMLNPVKGLHAYFYQNTTDGSIILEVGNIQSMPIELLNVSCNGSKTFEPKHNINILPAKKSFKPVQYEKIEFVIPDGFNWSDSCIADLRLNYNLLGTNHVRNETIFPWHYLSEDFFATDFIRQNPNVEKFDFLSVDNATNRISVIGGDWELTDNLIIPAGYTVICGEGTCLDLKNGATILSYSPLRFAGTEDRPILIGSSDSTGQGITVLAAGEKSILNRVVFKNLSAPSQHGWQLTGAVTFYESPVEIDGCQLYTNKAGDDMLNIVRSEFEIRNSLFKHALSDALDVDFGQGSISHTSFIDCGNDGLDFSGSVVDITECFVNGADDKGVSAGENSQVNMDQMEFKNCYVATASKDMSQVTIGNTKVSASEVGFAVYQKKSEFAPSRMVISSVDLVNVTTPYLIEEGSALSVNDQKIDANQKNVWEILYGRE